MWVMWSKRHLYWKDMGLLLAGARTVVRVVDGAEAGHLTVPCGGRCVYG